MEKVLVIDDDKISRLFLKKLLKEKYEVILAESGNEGLDLASQHSPEAILLDIEMPELNGYETCERFKSNPKINDIPIIFVSGKSSLDEKIKGYNHGGEDYLIKPPDQAELLAKVNVAVTNHQKRKALGSSAEMAGKMVQVALRGQGDMGTVIHFVEQVGVVPDLQALANRILAASENYGLSAVLMVDVGDKDYQFFSSQGSASPLERDLMQMMDKSERFVDFGKRTQINFSRLSLLLKNMPIDEEEKYGRIKDLMPPILAASNAHVFTLIKKKTISDLNRLLRKSVNTIDTCMADLHHSVRDRIQDMIKLTSANYKQMEYHVPNMGLEEDQESFIMDSIEHAMDTTKSIMDAQLEIEQAFTQISTILHFVEQKQSKLENLSSQEIESNEAEVMSVTNDKDSDIGSVELF